MTMDERLKRIQKEISDRASVQRDYPELHTPSLSMAKFEYSELSTRLHAAEEMVRKLELSIDRRIEMSHRRKVNNSDKLFWTIIIACGFITAACLFEIIQLVGGIGG
jgi:hypothetical protein